MDKLTRSQLPDSSSSPPLNSIFIQNFDDDGMSDLPSCVYANAHHHHQLNAGQVSFNNLNMPSTGSPTNNDGPFRQVQQYFVQHSNDISVPSTSKMGSYTSQPKAQRQPKVMRERKTTVRASPLG
jgi:hypothetical protein